MVGQLCRCYSAFQWKKCQHYSLPPVDVRIVVVIPPPLKIGLKHNFQPTMSTLSEWCVCKIVIFDLRKNCPFLRNKAFALLKRGERPLGFAILIVFLTRRVWTSEVLARTRTALTFSLEFNRNAGWEFTKVF